MTSEATGWGPDRRRAAVTVCVEGLAGEAGGAVLVSPALPVVLQALGERGLSATFFVESAVVEAEPLALTMIAGARSEVAAAETRAGARYVTTAAGDVGVADGLVRIPVGPPMDEAPGGPPAWHAAWQLAVARAVERGEHTALVARLAGLERGDAVGVLAETLDLVAGLRRAGRLWVPTLAELADWLLGGNPSSEGVHRADGRV